MRRKLSLPGWPVFREAQEQLVQAQKLGWQLVILSNTDRDLIEASIEAIGAPFNGAIVASEIGSYAGIARPPRPRGR